MFKRPIPRPPLPRATLPPVSSQILGSHGRASEIIRTMNGGDGRVGCPGPSEWRPPQDYEFAARHQDNPEAYLARVEAFFEQNPRPVPVTPKPKLILDLEPIHKLFKKHDGHRPPIDEHVIAMREAGYTEQIIAKAVARDEFLKSTSEARQVALDAIFARWPSINKPTPKPRNTKPIKAVKKKMT